MGSCVSNTDNGDSNVTNPKRASPNSKQNNRENHGKSAKKYAPAQPQNVRDQVHGENDNNPNDHISSDIQRLTDEKNVMENKDHGHAKKKGSKSKEQLSSEIQRLTDDKNEIKNNYKMELQKKTSEIAQLQERLKQSQHDNGKREKEMESYKRELKDKSNQISQIQEQMKKFEKDKREKEKERGKRYKVTVDSLRKELERTKQEKNDLLTRFSALAANKLTDGNANIADLSDENRPTKLSEKYSELYDNQWTDAFTYLSSIKERGEEELCSILVHAFCTIYSACRKKADADLKAFIFATDELYEADDLARDMIKTAKDRRKKRPRMKVEEIKQLYNSEMRQIIPTEEHKGIEPFLEKSIELCWLMAIQDPPVYVDTNLSLQDKPFETNSFKPYTVQGKYVDFIVWPALYLQEGGSLLCKGVAQGKTSRTPKNKSYDNVDILSNERNLSSLTSKPTLKPDTRVALDPANERSASETTQPESDKSGKQTVTSAGVKTSSFASGKPANEESTTDNTYPVSDSTRKLTYTSAKVVPSHVSGQQTKEDLETKNTETGNAKQPKSDLQRKETDTSSASKSLTMNAFQEKQDSVSSTATTKESLARNHHEFDQKSSSFLTNNIPSKTSYSDWQSQHKQHPTGQNKSVIVVNKSKNKLNA